MYFDLPKEQSSIIKVIGVGGGGCNAVNHMFDQGIKDVNFIICNTDQQALDMSPVPVKIQLGPSLTKGRGAGSHPHMGREATMESLQEIKSILEKNTEMVFITAGMGGGTGTGGAPVIARIAKEMGILTIAIVTMPFNFEGKRRLNQAFEGLEELKKNVDAILIISNDKLRLIYGNLPWDKAFSHADDVLATAAKGIAEIITIAGKINVDFEDVKTVLSNSGMAIMGTGRASGDERAKRAVEFALASPLLNDNDISGAKDILLNITSGNQPVLMDEISEILEYVQEASGDGCDIIWGNCADENVGDDIIVTIIATGFETDEQRKAREKAKKIIVSHLNMDELKNKPIVEQTLLVIPDEQKKTEQIIALKSEKKEIKEIKETKDSKEDLNPKQFVFEFNNDFFMHETTDEIVAEPHEDFVQNQIVDEIKNETTLVEEIKQEHPVTEFPISETEIELPKNDVTSIIFKEESRDILPEPTFDEKIIEPEKIQFQQKQMISEKDKMDHLAKTDMDRISRLKSMSTKINSFEELEKTPAYLRRDVDMKETQKSHESHLSQTVIATDDQNSLEIKKNNFLHGSVD